MCVPAGRRGRRGVAAPFPFGGAAPHATRSTALRCRSRPRRRGGDARVVRAEDVDDHVLGEEVGKRPGSTPDAGSSTASTARTTTRTAVPVGERSSLSRSTVRSWSAWCRLRCGVPLVGGARRRRMDALVRQRRLVRPAHGRRATAVRPPTLDAPPRDPVGGALLGWRNTVPRLFQLPELRAASASPSTRRVARRGRSSCSARCGTSPRRA